MTIAPRLQRRSGGSDRHEPGPTGRAQRLFVVMLRKWWSTQVSHRWMIDFLTDRALVRPVQVLIGLTTAALSTAPLLALASPAGPQTTAGRVVVVSFAVTGSMWALWWCAGPWPTRRLSFAFIMFSDAGITGVCLRDTDKMSGIAGLNALTLVSLYLVLFHGPRPLTAHCGWVLFSLLVLACQIGTGPAANPAMELTRFVIATLAIVAALPFTQIGIRMLSADADDSTLDPLTGLLNRRGMDARTRVLLDCTQSRLDIVVIAIDLDFFKHINDSCGHAIGDEVLIRTAHRLQNSVRENAVLARIGGEEFVVVDRIARCDIETFAERLHRTIGAPADIAPVTASIGVTAIAASIAANKRMGASELFRSLLTTADQALYRAKHDGRNRVVTEYLTANSPITGRGTTSSKVATGEKIREVSVRTGAAPTCSCRKSGRPPAR